jgi:hypothetical protein
VSLPGYWRQMAGGIDDEAAAEGPPS